MMINLAELKHLEILNVYTFPPVRIHLTSNSLKEFGLFKSELTYIVDLKTPNLREASYNYPSTLTLMVFELYFLLTQILSEKCSQLCYI